MQLQMFTNILLNISLLTLIATLITGFGPVKKLFSEEFKGAFSKNQFIKNILLAIFFGCISILSTYTGTYVNGAILNTRVIGVLAGGLLGGPVVGLGAGLIAGIHRYAFDVGGFTALSCTISTLLEGLLGSAIWYHHQKSNRTYDYLELFVVTFFAECMQMVIILLIAKPFARALQLVQIIAFPMIILNSIGICLFFSVFRHMMTEQDSQSARRISLTLEITNQCLPFLRKRVRTKDDWTKILSLLSDLSGCSNILISDTQKIVALTSTFSTLEPIHDSQLPDTVLKALESKSTQIEAIVPKNKPRFSMNQNHFMIASPLISKSDSIGCLVMILPQNVNTTAKTEIRFVDGLAHLFADQIALSELESQKKMLHKAEYQALQAQINPHFLFNSLNTISFFCREKPERARELLLSLSTYFRNTLHSRDYMVPLAQELEHVKAYLDLEKARFEDSLSIEFDFGAESYCCVPALIVQPIVENAVKHGAMKSPQGYLKITTRCEQNETLIIVSDNGPGIPASTITEILDHKTSRGVGLQNVHQRLQSIYGLSYGLLISSNEKGTQVTLRIPHDTEETYANSNH